MTDHLKTYGKRLIDNGYLVLPLPRGKKFPTIKGWQNARLTAQDLGQWRDHGVGVLCGQGQWPIVGVDVDISHPTIGPAVIDWCEQHLGSTIQRVGAAPRVMLVYRAAASGWAKGASVQFYDPTDPQKPSGKKNEQQVEILGLGQQFVAYHQHPDTGNDYEWVDLMDGMVNMPAADLPEITEDQVNALLAEVARLARTTPGVEVLGSSGTSLTVAGEVDDLALLSNKTDMTIADVRELMSHMLNDGDSYDTWVQVGAALHHEFHGTEHEDDALDLWREYGARSDKDRPNQYDYKWESFGRYSGASTTLRWLIKVANQEKNDRAHVVKLDAMESIKKAIADIPDLPTLGGTKFLEHLRSLLPDDQLLRANVVALFQEKHKALTGHNLPVGQARELVLGRRQSTVHSRRPLTEFGNAERMLDRYGDGLMYVPEENTWYMWTGVYWRPAVEVEIEHLAKETIRNLPSESGDHDDPSEFFLFCSISQQAKMVTNMIRLACSDPRVAVPARELDKHSHLLGVRNGVVDLRSGALLDPDPELRITMVAGCEFDPTAKCPVFDSTLLDCFFGDGAMANFFLRTLGYALQGNPTADVLIIPFGNGSNGKSTLYGVAREVFGAYAKSAEAGSFVKDAIGGNAGGPREDLVRLRGARFVYVNEPDENGELREGAIKSMTGGDAITARGVHAKKSLEIIPTWTVFMPTNHKPIVRGTDNGIWRRLVLLPFERNFEADKTVVKDEKRVEKLKAEMPGILARFVRAGIKYHKEGLAPPPAIQVAREAYRGQMDLLAEWLDECCVVTDASVLTPSVDLWASWELFAKNRGNLHFVKSSTALGRKLEQRFPAMKNEKDVRCRRGIALRSVTPDDFGDV